MCKEFYITVYCMRNPYPLAMQTIFILIKGIICVLRVVCFLFIFSKFVYTYFSFRNIRQVHYILMRLYTLVACGAISLSEEQHSVT